MRQPSEATRILLTATNGKIVRAKAEPRSSGRWRECGYAKERANRERDDTQESESRGDIEPPDMRKLFGSVLTLLEESQLRLVSGGKGQEGDHEADDEEHEGTGDPSRRSSVGVVRLAKVRK